MRVGRKDRVGARPRRAASLRGERSNVPRDNAALYGAGEDCKKGNNWW